MVKQIEIVGQNDTIILRDDALNYLRTTGGSGWGKAPVANQFTESARDGSTYRGTRVLPRTYTIPAYVFAQTIEGLSENISKLVNTVREKIFLRFTDETNQKWTIPAIYETGLEGAYTHGNAIAQFKSISFKCPDPFWTSEKVEVREWVTAISEPFLERRVLSASSLTGDRLITNLSDVSSKPTWVVNGPFNSFEVLVNGEGFAFEQSIALGEALTILFDGWTWTVKDHTGTNRYAGLQFAPTFPEIPPGESTLSLNLDGADEGTRVAVYWPQRREVMF